MNKKTMLSIASLFILLTSGCATPVVEQDRSGFISDYSELVSTSKNTYDVTKPELSRYSTFIVDTPQILFEPELVDNKPEFTNDELDELVAYAIDRLTNELNDTGSYTVTDQPGPDVGRIRLAITALDPSVGALNVLLYTKITGAGLGGAALEGEVVDSQSGQQLDASIQWGNGSRVLRAGLTKLGDAKLQINRWVRNLIKRLDAAHTDSS